MPYCAGSNGSIRAHSSSESTGPRLIPASWTGPAHSLGRHALGGIYALERLVFDSKRDHNTVVDVLSGFVREGSKAAALEESTSAEETPGPETDVQAALTVLGRLPPLGPVIRRADLAKAHLHGCSLVGADLSWADLSGADLTDADLSGADLGAAELFGADLTDADLSGADLESADLGEAILTNAYLVEAKLSGGANLTGADLTGAYLMGADLSKADLTGAYLTGAFLAHQPSAKPNDNLTGADLSKANLTGADLSEADLSGVDLSTALGLSDDQIAVAHSDGGTKLPEGLARPSAWERADET